MTPRAAPPRAARGATLLATLSGNLFLVLGSAVLGLAATLVGWIPPRGNLMFAVARLWSRGLLAASGVRVEVEIDPEVDPRRHCVVLANHLSLFDIPVLIATSPLQLRFMTKRSLFRIPVFGWALWVAGFIPVDLKDKSQARDTFRAAAARLRAGASVLVFPEGSRSLDGELQPFLSGGFLLALRSGLPILPVGIQGTFEVRHRRSFLIRPGRVRVRYGRPLPVEGYGVRRKAELMAQVRQQILDLSR